MDVEDIGEGEDALLCNTDKVMCCTNQNGESRAGEWYYPSGNSVDIEVVDMKQEQDEFYRDRGTQVVRLHRREGRIVERGRFQCKIPDAGDTIQFIYVHIGRFIVKQLFIKYVLLSSSKFFHSVNVSTVAISLSATVNGFAGNNLSLMCSSIISSTPPPQDMIFEWFFGPNGNSSLPPGVTASNVTNISSNYTSTLEFSPLLPAHTGFYTCQLGGNQRLKRNTLVTVINDCESPN